MEEATRKSDLLVRNEGSSTVKRTAKLYNLKIVIAVGMAIKRWRKKLAFRNPNSPQGLGIMNIQLLSLT